MHVTDDAFGDAESEPALRLLDEIGRLYRIARVVGPMGASEFSAAQVQIFFTLGRKGAARATALAECIGIDLSVASRQIAHLEEMGLVVRESDPEDGRASLVKLSPSGMERLKEIRARRAAQTRAALSTWSDEEIETAVDVLSALGDVWKEAM